MSEDVDIGELMAEPPGGPNSGRRRGPGGWVSIDTHGHAASDDGLWIDGPEGSYSRPVKPFETIRHGTAGAYTNDRCRCGLCREAWAAYKRWRRSQNG